MVTVAFKNDSGGGPLPWQILGFSPSHPSGVVVASGSAASGASVRREVSGYPSYQFLAFPGGRAFPSLPLDSDTQISVVFAATE